MAVEIDIVDAVAVPTAVVRRKARHGEIAGPLIDGLDKVYAVLRARGIRGGHNVAVYLGLVNGVVDFEVGVETSAPIDPEGEVFASATPAGRSALTVHLGPYAEIPRTTMAAMQACRDQGLEVVGPTWEVYGDHDDDPARLRTDLYFKLKA